MNNSAQFLVQVLKMYCPWIVFDRFGRTIPNFGPTKTTSSTISTKHLPRRRFSSRPCEVHETLAKKKRAPKSFAIFSTASSAGVRTRPNGAKTQTTEKKILTKPPQNIPHPVHHKLYVHKSMKPIRLMRYTIISRSSAPLVRMFVYNGRAHTDLVIDHTWRWAGGGHG